MDENIVKLNEKMKQLLAMAKKKQNVLEQSEIVAALSDVDFDADKVDHIYKYLENNGVDIVYPVVESDIDLDEADLSETDFDLENLDLSIPEGISVNALVDALNALITREKFLEITGK